MLLFVIVAVALVWMHFAIRAMETGRLRRGSCDKLPELPEMQEIHEAPSTSALARRRI